MALTRHSTQITWSGNGSVTLSANTRTDSDPFIFDDTDIAAAVQVHVENQGTPASGDTLDVWIKFTAGDVLGGGDVFDTNEHAQFLFRLDTFGTNTPGEDPACRTVDIPVGAKGIRLSVIGAQAATRNLVVAAMVSTLRAA